MHKPKPVTAKGGGWWLGVAVLGLLVLVALTLMRRGPAKGDAEIPAVVSADSAVTQTAPDLALPYQRVRGRWMRTDGDYLLDLRWVGSDGSVEAAYFNPRPVHVSRAEASVEDGRLRVLVELQDVGYPGCVYTLHYDAAADRLAGRYYQAALQETYVVEFSRTPDRPAERAP